MADWSDFPWRPGMRVLPDPANKGARMVLGSDYRWVFAVEAGIETTRDGGPCVEAWSDDAITGDEVPDLTDPATVGALAGAVREAWADILAHAWPTEDPEGLETTRWYVRVPGVYGSRAIGEGATEAEAWLAAWQARPKGGA